jgi:hypothetical protein
MGAASMMPECDAALVWPTFYPALIKNLDCKKQNNHRAINHLVTKGRMNC